MFAILVFKLPEEASEHKMYVRSSDYYCTITDILEYLRNQIKYQQLPEDKREHFEEVRDKIVEILNDRSLGEDFL